MGADRPVELLRGLLAARGAPAVDPVALAGPLAALLDGARAAWPGLAGQPGASDGGFVAYLAERLAGDRPPLEAIAALHAADLYLAWRCAEGSAQAIAAFERHHMREVGGFVARVASDPAFVDEVRQTLRRRLFVAERAPPRIAGYSGRGPIGGWLRVAAVRCALNLRRDVRAGERELDELVPSAADDPELGLLKVEHRGAVQAALDAALRELPPDDRAALKLHHVDGLTLDQLTLVFHTPRSTLARRLALIRRQVLGALRRRLVERIGLREGELESLLRIVRSQLRISIAGALK